jgi:hypothetical protein
MRHPIHRVKDPSESLRSREDVVCSCDLGEVTHVFVKRTLGDRTELRFCPRNVRAIEARRRDGSNVEVREHMKDALRPKARALRSHTIDLICIV